MNIRNIRLVKFPDGHYAVRKGWIFYRYKDIHTHPFWWSASDFHFKDCFSKDYDKVYSVWSKVREGVEIIL